MGRVRASSSEQTPGQALWLLGPAATPLCARGSKRWPRGTMAGHVVKTYVLLEDESSAAGPGSKPLKAVRDQGPQGKSRVK